jgi:serine/threonine protein kinase
MRNVFTKLLNGLREVHSHKLLHLDLKPSNIYMRNDYTPVLIDFGAARQTLASDTPMLKPMYTPGFASPEHYTQRELLGPWSDIYSVGASMYACLRRRRAAGRRQPCREGSLIPAMVRWEGLYSDQLLETIDWCLCLNHMYRPQSVFALQKALTEKVTKPEAPPKNWLDQVVGRFKERVTPSEIHHLSGKPPGKRANNEDRLAHCYSRDALLMVIADGMGGHYYGEVAAQIAVQTLAESFQREATPESATPSCSCRRHSPTRTTPSRFHRGAQPARLAAHDLRRLPDPEQRRLLGARRRFAPLSDPRRQGR